MKAIASLLCRCGRGIFSMSNLLVVHDDPAAFSHPEYVSVRCLKCGLDGVARLTQGRQRVAVGVREIEEMVGEAKKAYMEAMAPAPAPVPPCHE